VHADDGDWVVVAGFASPESGATFTESLSYTLDVTRVGRSRSTSHQSGRFVPAPGQSTTLATSRVSASPGDEIELILTVSSAAGVLDVARFRTAVTP
jgi:hypothetical protein